MERWAEKRSGQLPRWERKEGHKEVSKQRGPVRGDGRDVAGAPRRP